MWWNSMSTLQQVMFVIACVATAVLVIQIILMLINGAADSGFDGSAASDLGDAGDISDVSDIGGVTDADVSDIDVSGDGFEIDGGASDADISGGSGDDIGGGGGNSVVMPFGLRLLSLRAILAFVVVGAWVCYTACYGLEWYYAVIIAVACGFAAACGMAGALMGMEKLQANGTINPANAIGKTGTVYLTVPPSRSGSGKVNVIVQERYAEYEAVTDSAEPLPTASEIKVVGRTGNVLVVEKYKKPSVTIDNN